MPQEVLERAMGIEPTSETWEAIERDGLALVSYIARKRGFAKIHRTLLRLSTHLCYYESRMSALIFMGGSGRKNCYRKQSRRTVRCMQILQTPYLQAFTLSC